MWVMLMINSLTESDIRSTGIPVLDLWLAREASRLGKRSGAVERVEEQCLPLNGLNGSQDMKRIMYKKREREKKDIMSYFKGT